MSLSKRTAWMFPLWVVLLVCVGTLCIWWSQRPLGQEELLGTYGHPKNMLRPGENDPGSITLTADRVSIIDQSGQNLYEGPWTWNEREASIGTADPIWDHRIRFRHGWFGPRMLVRLNRGDIDDDLQVEFNTIERYGN